jgi:hypothetical protein
MAMTRTRILLARITFTELKRNGTQAKRDLKIFSGISKAYPIRLTSGRFSPVALAQSTIRCAFACSRQREFCRRQGFLQPKLVGRKPFLFTGSSVAQN